MSEMSTSKKIGLIALGCIAILGSGYMGYQYYEQKQSMKCNSDLAVSMINELADKQGIMLTELNSFSTINSTSNQTECQAFYRTARGTQKVLHYTLTYSDYDDNVMLEINE